MEAVVFWSRCMVDEDEPHWVASSVPVGAGMPDFILATYRPEIGKLDEGSDDCARVLAYLRLVRSARPETLAERIGYPFKRLTGVLQRLVDAEAVIGRGNVLRLATKWRRILPRTVAIEAKVSDWKKAVEQASRNTIFANYSYIALPRSLAEHVCQNALFDRLGLGLLGVEKGGDVRILRRAPRTKPIAWYYYYNLALTLSRTDEARQCRFMSPSTKPASASRTTPSSRH
jgi:hypothetical protein